MKPSLDKTHKSQPQLPLKTPMFLPSFFFLQVSAAHKEHAPPPIPRLKLQARVRSTAPPCFGSFMTVPD